MKNVETDVETETLELGEEEETKERYIARRRYETTKRQILDTLTRTRRESGRWLIHE